MLQSENQPLTSEATLTSKETLLRLISRNSSLKDNGSCFSSGLWISLLFAQPKSEHSARRQTYSLLLVLSWSGALLTRPSVTWPGQRARRRELLELSNTLCCLISEERSPEGTDAWSKTETMRELPSEPHTSLIPRESWDISPSMIFQLAETLNRSWDLLRPSSTLMSSERSAQPTGNQETRPLSQESTKIDFI